jgi:hypothetical protein
LDRKGFRRDRLSVVTAAEVMDSVAKAKREGVTRKANLLSQWWDTA